MPYPSQSPSSSNSLVSLALLVPATGLAGTYADFNFEDGTINYLGVLLRQTFQYTLIDNRGAGSIRICYNRPGYSLTTGVAGSKTLGSGDSIYIEEDVWHVRIYYITPSVVELVLKSDKSGGYGI